MSNNPLLELQDYGQSVWLDFLSRKMLDNGQLEDLIDADGLRGVTVNPSILDEAIRTTDYYEGAIQALLAEGYSPAQIYEHLATQDVRRACDLYAPVYEGSEGHHGFVSLEVSPHLAYDTEGTIDEASRFWRTVNRPNLLIKVPATPQGLPAIRQLIGQGINVNVTLLFGLPRYERVAEAYMAGIEERITRGQPVERIASVASFFLSRIDVLVDGLLDEIIEEGGRRGEMAASLRGQVAVASGRLAYQIYQPLFEDGRFHSSAEHGARVQRLLWASTSTKDPAYSDIKYVEALIGPRTVNTMPLETLEAYRDHGDPAPRLQEHISQARETLVQLEELGIEIDEGTAQLEEEGVRKFAHSYDALIEHLGQLQPMA